MIANNNNLFGNVGYLFGFLNLIDIRSNPNMYGGPFENNLGLLLPTDSVIVYNNLLCPYIKSYTNLTMIMVDPSYYNYTLCEPCPHSNK